VAELTSTGVITALSGDSLAWLLPVLERELGSVHVHRHGSFVADAPISPATLLCVDASFIEDEELLHAIHALAPRLVAIVVGPPSFWSFATDLLVQLGITPRGYLTQRDDPESVAVRLQMLSRLASTVGGVEASPEQLDEERNRVVAHLAGAVAHKLKQPLTVALGFLELVLDDPDLELDSETLGYLTQTREALDSMDDVVNRLQEATHYQTRPYAGTLEILDIDGGEGATGR